MKKYIALLRGINVGGNNKISMPVLKQAMEQHGFTDVITYINSGNVIFSSPSASEEHLKQKCELLIAEIFHLHIQVAVISADNLAEALEHAPAWWGQDKDAKHNAIFVISPSSVSEVLQAVGEIKPAYEKIDYYGSVIFWSAPIATFSHTRWSKVVSSPVYNSITIRNANTAYKLSQIAK